MHIDFDGIIQEDQEIVSGVLDSVLHDVHENFRVLVRSHLFEQWCAERYKDTEYDLTIIGYGSLFYANPNLSYTTRLDNGDLLYDVIDVPNMEGFQSMELQRHTDAPVPIVGAANKIVVCNAPLRMLAGYGKEYVYDVLSERIREAVYAGIDNDELLTHITNDREETINHIIASQSGERVQSMRAEIDESVQRLTQYYNRARALQTTLREQQELYDAAVAIRENGLSSEYVTRELDAITRHEKVRKMCIHDETITVLTEPITITDTSTGESAELGPYNVDIVFGSDRDIKITNLVNPRGGYDHPHVRQGAFCAGEWQPTVNSLLQQSQIASAINFVISCLGQVNRNDDWGRHIAWWFGEEVDD